jgi:hypothetical protein
VLAPLGKDRLRLREGELVNERFVDAVEDAVAPADLADVGRVADDPVHAGMAPSGGGCWRSLVVQGLGDRAGAEPLACVQIEHTPHDGRLDWVGDKHALLVREEVAEGWAAAEPAPLLGPSFDAGADAVDDGGVFELGEHGQHLQHHPTRRGAGVERLGRRAQHDVEGVEFFGELSELPDFAAEAVDAVDKQHVDGTGAGEVERCLKAGPVELCPGRLVLLVGDDPPPFLCFAERFEPFPLRVQRGRLVLLVS